MLLNRIRTDALSDGLRTNSLNILHYNVSRIDIAVVLIRSVYASSRFVNKV